MEERVSKTMAQEVISRLETMGYGDVVCVDEVSADRFEKQCDELVDELEAAGRQAVVLDGQRPNRGRGIVCEVVSNWVEEQCQQGDEDLRTVRLFDYLTTAMDMGSDAMEAAERGNLIVDAIVQLVERLVEKEPAVLIVASPQELSAIDRQALDSLIGHFLADPLADIDPDLAKQAPLGFVWLGPWDHPAGMEAEKVELEGQATSEIRRFLSEDRIVEQLLETTQGDPRHLEALFDGLPATVSHLWERRVVELSPQKRRVAQYLAVAGVPLEISFLDRLVDDTSVVSAVRELSNGGIAMRQVIDGSVTVSLGSEEICSGVKAGLDDSVRRQLHLDLMLTAMNTGGQDEAFIASHALAGDDEEVGVRYGIPASRKLLRRGQWEEADQLLTKLRKVTELAAHEERQILESSLRLAEGQSAWREALEVAGRLEKFVDSDAEMATVKRRLATYLTKLGQAKSAQAHFQEALDCLEGQEQTTESARALLGLAEIAYRDGEHEKADQWATEASEQLRDGGESPEADKLLLECRRILGKVALYSGELEQAQRYFEKNAALARRHGWRGGESGAEVNLGVVALQQRRYEKAAQSLDRALEKGDVPGGAQRLHCWLNLGIVHQRRANLSKALDYYRRSLREASRRQEGVAYEIAVHNLATLYQDLGAYDEARQLVAHLRSRGEAAQQGGGNGSFALRWAAMVEAQILLEEGEVVEAVEALKQAEADLLTYEQRLYGVEMKLRCISAHLMLDEVDKAQEVLDDVDDESVSTPQCSALYEYYQAAVARRREEGPDEAGWRSIMQNLNSLGLVQDGMAARLELAKMVESIPERGAQAAQLLLERGVEDLRQRAQRVPERFRDCFFSIQVHRRLLEEFQRLSGDGAPPELAQQSERDSQNTIGDDDGVEASTERQEDPAYQRWRARYSEMVGEDPKVLQVFRYIDRVAPSETTILLTGESGTGKEMVAESLHRQSQRGNQRFVKVNCAAFVEDLLLSELFGHKKGAFTGAISDRAGRFECADGGTIFLDEIGDISPKTQVALLRVLQEGTFEPVGGTETKKVDVRVVAATNRNLDEMVREGSFRLDLYYRLKGFLIELPALRQRRSDIPVLLHHFAQQFSAPAKAPRFCEEAVQFLAQYRWPGNVRELKNFVRSVLLFADGPKIEMDHLAQFREFFSAENMDQTLPPVDPDVYISEAFEDEQEWQVVGDTEEALAEQVVADEQSLSDLKKRIETKCIMRALRQTGGNISQAARILQMKRPRLSQIVNGSPDLLALKEELVG